MDHKERCQSCGMPVSDDYGNRGTEADSSLSFLYCGVCYRDGEFTMPDMTVGGMIAMSIYYMTETMGYSREDAEQMSNDLIPTLERWNVT